MRTFFHLLLVASTTIGPAIAEPISVDAPLLDQKDTQVSQQIFDLEKNGVLSSTEAAVLQARRGNIMRDASLRRKRNKGILPTSDVRDLCNRMDAIAKQVNKQQ
jgi:hypothetical protein